MSDSRDVEKYDDVLTSILVNEKSIIGFLSAVFGFLARRTDFYYVPDGQYENMGFPPGVAEELVIKMMRKCDPKNWETPNGAQTDINSEIMCSTVAQEVEITAEDDIKEDANLLETTSTNVNRGQETSELQGDVSSGPQKPEDADTANSVSEEPPVIPVQKNSECYNGAERDNYCWAQTITELDVTVKLPPDIKSAKELKVTINPNNICVAKRNGEVIVKDNLAYKIKANESFWSISEGKLLIHLEKVQERWWVKLLESEEEIDLNKIDCSRPLNELPEDHIAKVRELQWNQEQKRKGLPTSDEIRNLKILQKAWNADGSPFKGQEFDPNIFKNSQNFSPQ